MKAFVFRRLVGTLPVLWGVVTLVFFLIHLIPGDPIDLMLGENAMPAQREELRMRLHLNEPIWKQYGQYIVHLSQLDLGTSIRSGDSVVKRITTRFPNTLMLSALALTVALCLALPVGLFAAANKETFFDHALMSISLFGLSVPTFWLGPILALFLGFHLGWFPISGGEGPLSIVLPAMTLALGMVALLTRVARNSVLDVLREDYVRTARAKGLTLGALFFKHVLKNAMLPIVTIAGLQAGALLSGAVITERIFSWPGLGLELMDAIEARDYPVVQGVVLVIALSYVFINFLTDIAYAAVDPRIRQTRRGVRA